MTDPLAAACPHPLPFNTLPGFSRLFADYAAYHPDIAPYYVGDYRTAAERKAAADRAAAYPRDREALAEVLLDQNERWGMSAAVRANIEALRDPETVVVVTGQQVGLFGGPLYTPYKTLTTMLVAQQVAAETGRKVVPVFWLGSDDHDLEEVATTYVYRQNEIIPLAYTGHRLPAQGNLGPVGRLVLTEQIETVVAALEEALPPTDFKPALMAAVRAAYRPGATLLDAFARLMRTFFAKDGVVFVSPDDVRLKRLALPLYRQEIEAHADYLPELAARSTALEATYHAQVHIRPTNLFLLQDGGRYPIDAEADGFHIRGTDAVYTKAALLALLNEAPERFSPNVVLRPLTQDVLFPTVAYVGGPGEIAYFAQYAPVYAWAGVPMPLVYPRVSVTLMEGKVQKVLDRYQLALGDAAEEPEKLFRRVVLAEMAIDLEATFDQATRHLHTAINDLKPTIGAVDASLVRTAEATRVALVKELSQLKGRVLKAEKRQQDTVRAQLEKMQINLYPLGKPQERVISPLYYANKYGLDFFSRLQKTFSADTSAHHVLPL